MTSREYRAMKNFFHNTCGLSRQEIAQIVREVIREMVQDEFFRHGQTNDFKRLVESQAERLLRSEHCFLLRNALITVIEKSISITLKEVDDGPR